MNMMIRPPFEGGLSSGKRSVPRITGDPRTDVLLDEFASAEGSERHLLREKCLVRLGEACAELPFDIPCRVQGALDILSEGNPEVWSVSQAVCNEAESRRAAEINSTRLRGALERIRALVHHVACDDPRAQLWRLRDAVNDSAEELGRETSIPPVEIVAALADAVPLGINMTERDFDHALTLCSRTREVREAEITSALWFWPDEAEERYEAGTLFETYEVDLATWSPSPSDYYGEIAERDAAERAEIAERDVRVAEIEIAGSGLDIVDALGIARRTSRKTSGCGIAGYDLADRLAAAFGERAGLSTHRTQMLIEISVEAAREGWRPYDDAVVATFVAEEAARVCDGTLDLIGPIHIPSVVVLVSASAEPVEALAEAKHASALDQRATPAERVTEEPATMPAEDGIEPKVAQADVSTDAAFEALTHVPGLVGEIVDWMEASATYPNRTLALAATIVFLGTLMGRLYKSPSGFRTNLYAIGLAPSGFGKDHARKCLDSIDMAGGFGAWFGGDGIASASGMRKRVEHHASIMWKIDEFGGFMRKIGDPRAGQHVAQIRDNLLKYYGTAGSVFRGEDYAGEQGRPCYHPNVALYGTSTPTDFWGACRSLSVGDGLLARMMIFSVGAAGRPARVRPSASYEEPPTPIIEACRLVATPKCGGNIANLMDGSRPSKPFTVPYGLGAEVHFEAMIDEFAAKTAKADAEVESFFQRVCENAVKIALVIAVGIDADKPTLTIDCLQRGRQIAELCLETAISEVKGRLADNDRQREHIDVRRWIEEAGARGMSKTELSRRINGRFDARRRDDILKTLIDDERMIEAKLTDGVRGGQKGCRFVALKNLKGEEL